jgi:hypothetical protein
MEQPITRQQELQLIADAKEDDRNKMITLYRAIQAISNNIPNFNNPEIDKTANTIMESLKLMEKWLADTCQQHFH